MGKRKKSRVDNAQNFINNVNEQLQELRFKELKMLYEEQPENDLERYIKTLVLQEMKRRNPKWEP